MNGDLSDAERIQRAMEEEEFARGHVEPGSPPVEPRAAATICLARPAGSGFEVLLLRRPLASRFAAGAYVFPGGTIDPQDRSAAALERLVGEEISEAEALFAALREAFEETGVLLAAAGQDPEAVARVLAGRDRLLGGETTFPELLAESDVELDASSAVYFTRWITPVQLDRRYDTRFFLARHPGGEPRLTREHTDFRWLEPSVAVEMFGADRLPMLFPTRKTLELLSRFDRLEDVFTSFRKREVKPILARIVVEDGRVVPVPFDYD